MTEENKPLWEGYIPVVADFDLSAVQGKAKASEDDSGHVTITLTLTPEDANTIKNFLQEQIPRALSWYTQAGPEAIAKHKEYWSNFYKEESS